MVLLDWLVDLGDDCYWVIVWSLGDWIDWWMFLVDWLNVWLMRLMDWLFGCLINLLNDGLFLLFHWFMYRLVDVWFIVWLFDWLIGWLMSWLLGWWVLLLGCLVDLLTNGSFGCLIEWWLDELVSDRSIDWLIKALIDRLIDWLNYVLIVWLMFFDWLLDRLIDWFTDL